MNPEVEEILSRATADQVEWVAWRTILDTDKEASKKIGIHHKTVYQSAKWKSNKRDLDHAVQLLKHDAAMGALFALENLALDAVKALSVALTDKRQRVQAAREILSRVLPEKRLVELGNGALKVEYVNDWRENSFAESARGPENGKATGQAVQLVERGPAVAKNDNGNVDRGRGSA